jgi:RHS repeat-associated protein
MKHKNNGVPCQGTPFTFLGLGNHLGSTSLVVDDQGTEVGYVIYDAYGQIVENTLPSGLTDRLYTGQVFDESTGLFYYNARYYDPFAGQFTQPDSIIPDSLNPAAWNRFSYVYGNPTNLTDPSGHCAGICVTAIGIGVGALVGGTIGATYAYNQGYDLSTPEFWRYTATGALIGGAVGGVVGGSIGIAGSAIRAASITAYSQSPLFSWWAGGGMNILRTWGSRSIMQRVGGGLGLLLRIPTTPFAGAQMSENFMNALPGALGRAALGNPFVRDGIISTLAYVGYNGLVNRSKPFWGMTGTGAASAFVFGGVGGALNTMGQSLPTALRAWWHFTASEVVAAGAYASTNYVGGGSITNRGMLETLVLGGIGGQANFIPSIRWYIPTSLVTGVAAGITNEITPW